MRDEEGTFEFRRWTSGPVAVLELRGELDLYGVTIASAELVALAREHAADLLVDMRKVTFIDCSGLSLLCRMRRQVLAQHGRMQLVISDPRVLRLLRLARLADAFDIIDAPDLGRVPTACALSPVAPEG